MQDILFTINLQYWIIRKDSFRKSKDFASVYEVPLCLCLIFSEKQIFSTIFSQVWLFRFLEPACFLMNCFRGLSCFENWEIVSDVHCCMFLSFAFFAMINQASKMREFKLNSKHSHEVICFIYRTCREYLQNVVDCIWIFFKPSSSSLHRHHVWFKTKCMQWLY